MALPESRAKIVLEGARHRLPIKFNRTLDISISPLARQGKGRQEVSRLPAGPQPRPGPGRDRDEVTSLERYSIGTLSMSAPTQSDVGPGGKLAWQVAHSALKLLRG